MVALVDDQDYEYLNQWRWCAHKDHNTYYATRAIRNGKKTTSIIMHRIILDVPAGMEVDHIDHNGLNNQRSNIRIATHQQNMANLRPWGKSKYLGVSFCNSRGYVYIKATVYFNGKNKCLGSFSTEEDAARAYNEFVIKHRGEYANLNVIP